MTEREFGFGFGFDTDGRDTLIASGNFTNIATNNAADGVYTLNGETVTIGDIIDLDDEFALFDPATDIDAGGMKVRVDGSGNVQGLTVSIQPDLVLEMCATGGMTAVFELEMSDSFGVYFYLYSPGLFNESNGVTVGRGNNGYVSGIDLTSFDGTNQQRTTAEWVPPAGPCKVAVSFVDDHLAVSVNGGPVFRYDHPGCAVDCNYGQFLIGGASPDVLDGRLGSFTFNSLAADADLPGLSALS